MKKTITLLIIVAMCLSLSACIIVQNQGDTKPQTEAAGVQDATTAAQHDTTEALTDIIETEAATQTTEAVSPLVGVWKRTVFFNTADLGLEGVEADFSVPVSITFDEAGTYAISLDLELFEASMIDAYVPVLMEEIYAEYAAQGMDEAAAEEDVLAVYGMTVEEYARVSADLMNFASLIVDAETTGTYYLEGDKLYTDAGTDKAEVYTIQLGKDALNFQRAEKSITWSVFRIPFPFMLARAE